MTTAGKDSGRGGGSPSGGNPASAKSSGRSSSSSWSREGLSSSGDSDEAGVQPLEPERGYRWVTEVVNGRAVRGGGPTVRRAGMPGKWCDERGRIEVDTIRRMLCNGADVIDWCVYMYNVDVEWVYLIERRSEAL